MIIAGSLWVPFNNNKKSITLYRRETTDFCVCRNSTNECVDLEWRRFSPALSLLSLTLFVVNSWALGDWNADSREESRSLIDGCATHFNMKLVSLDGEWESYMHYAAEDGTAACATG